MPHILPPGSRAVRFSWTAVAQWRLATSGGIPMTVDAFLGRLIPSKGPGRGPRAAPRTRPHPVVVRG